MEPQVIKQFDSAMAKILDVIRILGPSSFHYKSILSFIKHYTYIKVSVAINCDDFPSSQLNMHSNYYIHTFSI
jgi:hypothetical protein